MPIRKTGQARPRITMLYGPGGIGKSTWAASAPDPVFVQTEDGLEDIAGASTVGMCESWPDFGKKFTEAVNDPHKFMTVVIDSLGFLERLMIEHTRSAKSKEVADAEKFSRVGDLITPLWLDVLDMVTQARNIMGVNVIMLAHSTTEKVGNPDGSDYARFCPLLERATRGLLHAFCDDVLMADRKIFTKTEEGGFNKKTTKALRDANRICYTGSATRLVKSRLAMPDEIPLEWAEYAKYWPKPEVSNGKN